MYTWYGLSACGLHYHNITLVLCVWLMSLHAAHFFCCPQSICIPHTHLPHAYLLFFIPLCLSPFFTHYYWCSLLLLFLLYVWYRWSSFLLVFFTYYRTIDELTWFILNDKGFKNKFLSSACLKTSPSTKGKQQVNLFLLKSFYFICISLDFYLEKGLNSPTVKIEIKKWEKKSFIYTLIKKEWEGFLCSAITILPFVSSCHSLCLYSVAASSQEKF